MTTTTTLSFTQLLLLMEALDKMADTTRDKVAAGDDTMQGALTEIEAIQHLIDTAAGIQVLTTKAA